jgi:zinc and cadmium transporter
MPFLLWIILFTLLGGVLSVAAAAVFLLLPEKHHPSILPHGVSFATGALLSVAFWDLLPEAVALIEMDQVESLFLVVLLGILAFFLLEKLLLWRHSHVDAYSAQDRLDAHFHQPAGALIVLGDGIHNFVDGVLIAAAFLADVQLGIVTSLAVAAHEIPQEVGDFAILLESGYSKLKAFLYNMLSSLATVLGGVLAYFSLERLHGALPYFLALAASSFIYVAIADLIPNLHRKTHAAAIVQQMALIAAGVLLIGGLHGVVHKH